MARDLVWPWLVGSDAQYVYWLSHEPDPEQGAGYQTYSASLMRVAKIGGVGQLLFDSVLGENDCDLASDGETIFIVASGNHTTHAILSVRAHGSELEQPRVFREGVEACRMLISGGRLYWTESGPREPPPFSRDADPNDAPHASLHSANLDGSDERVLWKNGEDVVPVALFEQGASLILVLAPAPEQYGLGLLGDLGSAPTAPAHGESVAPEPSSVVLRLPRGGGAPRVLWSRPGKLRFAGVQATTVFLCASDGLYRLSLDTAAPAARIREAPCGSHFRVWNGWTLQGPPDLDRPAPLIADRLAPPPKHVVFDSISPGEPLGFTLDSGAVYACRHAPAQAPGHCDLIRTERRWLDARDATTTP